MPFVQYVTFKTEPCKEGWDAERICTTHDHAWSRDEPVCNAILNAADEATAEGTMKVEIKWEEEVK